MNVTLSAEHRRWLTQQVADGKFATVEDCVASAIEQLRISSKLDLEWARPHLAAAEASLARGEGIEGKQFLDRLGQRLAELKAR